MSTDEQIRFPASLVNRFRHRNLSQRWGQAFYDFAELHKSDRERDFCDRLYNEPDNDNARLMVAFRTDFNQ